MLRPVRCRSRIRRVADRDGRAYPLCDRFKPPARQKSNPRTQRHQMRTDRQTRDRVRFRSRSIELCVQSAKKDSPRGLRRPYRRLILSNQTTAPCAHQPRRTRPPPTPLCNAEAGPRIRRRSSTARHAPRITSLRATRLNNRTRLTNPITLLTLTGDPLSNTRYATIECSAALPSTNSLRLQAPQESIHERRNERRNRVL